MTKGVVYPSKLRLVLAGMLLSLFAGDGALAQTTPPAPVLSGTLPDAVPAHTTQTPEAARPFFDSFSWQSFVALMWPVNTKQRGVPLNPANVTTLTRAGNSYPTVWGSYLTDTELFPGGTARPQAWDSPERSAACPGAPADAKVLTMISKSANLLTDMSQSFSFPLVDQNRNYIYYQIAFNETLYDFVRGTEKDPNTWLYRARYLAAAEMKTPIAMPISSTTPSAPGAMMLKAAWKQLTAKDDVRRYYWVSGFVYDTSSGSPVCRAVKLGLIGLHIARKVAPFPQWIWSSFEQVDNVPPDHGMPTHMPMTLNNGKATPVTDQGWANRPDDKMPLPANRRLMAQVTRFNPIPTTPAGNGTTDINARWQKSLVGTPLAFYQAVITQWPSEPVAQDKFQTMEAGGSYPTGPGQPFPRFGAVNTAMETYFQSQRDAAGAGGNSCMQCHYVAGKADFSWSLTLRSY